MVADLVLSVPVQQNAPYQSEETGHRSIVLSTGEIHYLLGYDGLGFFLSMFVSQFVLSYRDLQTVSLVWRFMSIVRE